MHTIETGETFLIRFAFEEEIKANQTSWLSSPLKKTSEAASVALNTASLAWHGGDLYRFFGSPIPEGTPFKIFKTHTGWNWYVYSSSALFRTLSSHHRNLHQDGFFANDIAAKTLLEIGFEIFKEKLHPEDTISTCTEDNSKIYRAIFMRHLGSAALKPRLDEIDQLAEQLFHQWGSIAEVNITEACQLFVSAVINSFLLGLDQEDSLSVAKAIVVCNSYVLAKAAGNANAEEFEKNTASILRITIEKAIKNQTDFIQALDQSELTEIQKKALLIVIYFTGLGGTISQIGGLLWHLAKHPEYQEELFQEIKTGNKKYPFTAALIKESFRVHPSTLTIDRPTAKPLVVEHVYKETHQEIYIPEKSILTFFQPWSSEKCENPKMFDPHRKDQVENYDFGHGVHKCVGQFIAEELIGRFIRAFTKRYIFSSQLEELPIQGYFNLEPKSDVILQIKERKQ